MFCEEEGAAVQYRRRRNALLWKKFLDVLKSWLFLLTLLIYQSLFFVAFLSSSIGLATLLSYVVEVILDFPLPQTAQSIITLSALSMCGEAHVIIQSNSRFGHWMRATKKKYPCILGFIPGLIYLVLYFVAMAQLCQQYLVVHEIKSWGSDRRKNGSSGSIMSNGFQHLEAVDSTLDSSTNGTSLESNTNIQRVIDLMNNATFIFLLSISYMTYLVARANDWTYYRCCHFSFLGRTKLGSWWTFFVFYVIQVVLLMLYLFPVVFICVLCRFMFLPPEVNFIIINLSCAMVGLNAIDIEAKKPFPIVPQQPPSYDYENHLLCRAFLLTYSLYPMIVIPFFLSNTVPADKSSFQVYFNDETRYFIFAFAVGTAFLQTVKCVINVAYSKDLIFHVQPNGNRVLVGIDDGLPGPHQHHAGAGGGGAGLGIQGMLDHYLDLDVGVSEESIVMATTARDEKILLDHNGDLKTDPAAAATAVTVKPTLSDRVASFLTFPESSTLVESDMSMLEIFKMSKVKQVGSDGIVDLEKGEGPKLVKSSSEPSLLKKVLASLAQVEIQMLDEEDEAKANESKDTGHGQMAEDPALITEDVGKILDTDTDDANNNLIGLKKTTIILFPVAASLTKIDDGEIAADGCNNPVPSLGQVLAQDELNC